jgi:MarR family 2-MHQ and catechol resistance regulon transcriptional repressor
LEANELVRRERSLEDRRCVFVHLTKKGRSLISDLLPEHVAAITQEMRYLTPDELVELGRLCRKLGLADKVPA